MKESREITPEVSLSLWSRCNLEDIKYAAQLNPDIISLSIPVSDLHIEKKLGKNRPWIRQTLIDSLKYASNIGFKKISLGLEDATRADPCFLQEIIKIASEKGAQRIRIADTVGIATPMEMINTLQGINAYGMEIGVHTHNDFGMATANAISALQAGAQWADATVLGLGERAGNARLEELAGFFTLKAGWTYRTEKLRPLCSLVSEAAAKAIDQHHPIIGDNIFTCETGMHLQGLNREHSTYEPYNPKQVGAVRRLLYGAKIGRNSLSGRLNHLQIRLSPEKLEELFPAFREKAGRLGRPLFDKEIVELCQ
ncbi:pyruvate carboxyltransferase [bacterium]|nr:pyruvate carboxyltransferase [bacterium]